MTVVAGKIVKAQGIKGELKVMPFTQNPERFLSFKQILIDNSLMTIQYARLTNGFVFLKLEEINDRNCAEEFKDKLIHLKEEDKAPLNEGEYFITDVLGCNVYDCEGKELGKITDIQNYGSADVYTLKSVDSKTIRFPFLNDIVIEIDTKSHKMTVNKDALMRLGVYED